MEESSELLVLALEQLEEHRQDDTWGDEILASEYLETCNHSHSGLLVQYRIVLLEDVQQLIREVVDNLFLVLMGDLYTV